MINTKDKILNEALSLFSAKGYDPVSIRDIARAVGIKESSIYNHYKNKQDIFDSIIAEYSSRWDTLFERLNLTGEDKKFAADDKTVNMYKSMTNEQLVELFVKIFDNYFTDDITIKLHRMLTIEQYRNPELAKLYRDISFDNSIDYQAQLFAAFMDAGHFVKCDPYILALEFFSPIFLIFYKFDKDEKGITEGRELFLRHTEHFNNIYGTGKTNKE